MSGREWTAFLLVIKIRITVLPKKRTEQREGISDMKLSIPSQLLCYNCEQIPLQKPRYLPQYQQLCCEKCTLPQEYPFCPSLFAKRKGRGLVRSWKKIQIFCDLCSWKGPIEKYQNHECRSMVECPICLEPMEASNGVKRTPCQHFFCKSCITESLDQLGAFCPYCRFKCSKEDLRDIERYDFTLS